MKIAINGGEPVRDEFLTFFKPELEEKAIEEVVDTLKSGWITTGPKTFEFEKKFANYIGIKNAVAVNSCTAGLHLALESIGIKEGDEVITTPYTFAATSNVIEQLGARPVFVDVDPETLNIDVTKIEPKININTKAILPVHFAGHPCDMDEILKIAEKHSLYVVEDAAHATEAIYKERKIGTIGHITIFSFYATKNLCTAEGGMITTMDDELAERMRIMALHGISKDAWKRYGKEGSWFYEVKACGFKYNFTDIQASLGLHQLDILESNHIKRKKIFDKYNEFFSSIDKCKVPVAKDNVKHAYHIYTLRIDFSELECDRAEFINALVAENIGVSVHFIPLHIQPYYAEKYSYSPEDYPVAYNEYMKEITLPLFPGMTENDINDVCMAVEKILKYYSPNLTVLKKIDNKDLNMRSIKAREYIQKNPTLAKIRSYFSEEEYLALEEELERKIMEIVLETISLYYEDEAVEHIKNGIEKEIEKILSQTENKG